MIFDNIEIFPILIATLLSSFAVKVFPFTYTGFKWNFNSVKGGITIRCPVSIYLSIPCLHTHFIIKNKKMGTIQREGI